MQCHDARMTKLHHAIEGSGPVVVLLHAGVADLRMWQTQVGVLAADRTVVRCDLPGYGGTAIAPGGDNSDAEDVIALLDELRIERFALVGASYGGYVALQVASTVPERVERMVLLNPAADLVEPDESMRDVWRQEGALVEGGDVAAAADLMVDTFLGPEAGDDQRALVRDMQSRAYELQLAAGDEESRDLPVSLERILAPVTVVVGDQDLAFFQAIAGALSDGLPNSDLVRLPWAGHLPSLERPDETARLVATALG